jgi:hypothetical protein
LKEHELQELAALSKTEDELAKSVESELSDEEQDEYRQLSRKQPLDAEEAKRMTELMAKNHTYEITFAFPHLPFEQEKRLLQLRYMKGSELWDFNPLSEEDAAEAAELHLVRLRQEFPLSKEEQLRLWELRSRDPQELNPDEKDEAKVLMNKVWKQRQEQEDKQRNDPVVRAQAVRLHELHLKRLSKLPKEQVREFAVLWDKQSDGELQGEERAQFDILQRQVAEESKERFPAFKRRYNACRARLSQPERNKDEDGISEDTASPLGIVMENSFTPAELRIQVQSLQETADVSERTQPDFHLTDINKKDLLLGEPEKQFIDQLAQIQQTIPISRQGDQNFYFRKLVASCQTLDHTLAIGFPDDNPAPLMIKTSKDDQGLEIESGNYRWKIKPNGTVEKKGILGTVDDLYNFFQALGTNNVEEMTLAA